MAWRIFCASLSQAALHLLVAILDLGAQRLRLLEQLLAAGRGYILRGSARRPRRSSDSRNSAAVLPRRSAPGALRFAGSARRCSPLSRVDHRFHSPFMKFSSTSSRFCRSAAQFARLAHQPLFPAAGIAIVLRAFASREDAADLIDIPAFVDRPVAHGGFPAICCVLLMLAFVVIHNFASMFIRPTQFKRALLEVAKGSYFLLFAPIPSGGARASARLRASADLPHDRRIGNLRVRCQEKRFAKNDRQRLIALKREKHIAFRRPRRTARYDA